LNTMKIIIPRLFLEGRYRQPATDTKFATTSIQLPLYTTCIPSRLEPIKLFQSAQTLTDSSK